LWCDSLTYNTAALAAAIDLFGADHVVIDERQYRRRDGSFIWTRVNLSVHRATGGHAQHVIAVVEPSRKIHEAVNIHQLLAAEPFIILVGFRRHIGHCGGILLGLNLGYSHGSPLKDTGGVLGRTWEYLPF